MAFISPALISRIYQALGQNRGRQAILLLRQHSFETEPAHDNELLPAILRIADEALHENNYDRAEDHYRLGLALYNACFHASYAEALRCASGLLQVYMNEKRPHSDIIDVLTIVDEITRRIRTDSFMKPRVVAERKVC